MGSSLKTQDDTLDVGSALVPFRRFDAAVAAASAQVPADETESMRILRALIDDLPQRNGIQDVHADRWLARTVKGTVERFEQSGEPITVASVHKHVLWHIRRASGFGGSEIGTVMAGARGEKGTFTDIRTLVMEKLLILAPQPGTIEMTRGIRAEPWMAKMLHEQLGCRRREDLLGKLRDFRWDKRPCLIGTPDDIVELRADDVLRRPDGTILMLDYKAPSADVCADYEKNGISSDYRAQIHHYSILAMAAGVRFDELAIEVLDPRSFTITPYRIEFDKELAKNIHAAAGHFWDEFVMKGELPAKIEPTVLGLEDPAIVDLGYKLAAFKTIEEQVKGRIKETQEQISLLGTNWHELATGNLDLDIASFTRARAWDETKLLDLAEAAGVDPDRFRTRTDKLDVKEVGRFLAELDGLRDDPAGAMDLLTRTLDNRLCHETKLDVAGLAAQLEADGVSLIAAMKVNERFLLTRKKAGPGVEKLSELKDNVADLVEAMEIAVIEQIPAIRDGVAAQPAAEEMADEYDAMAMAMEM